MQTFIISMMNKGFGYFGVLFLIALENLFPPIPSEVILTLGGFMTSYTKMTLVGVIIFSTLGSLLGAIILYYIGKILKVRRVKRIINSKFGRFLGLKDEQIDSSLKWFKEKGKKTVFFCRFIPVIRSLISLPAGIFQMDLKTFLIFTLLGSIIWNSVLVIAGRIVGEKWHMIVEFISRYTLVWLILFIIFIIIVIFYKHFKNKKNCKTK